MSAKEKAEKLTPAEAFSRWLNEGPKLAAAAGLYVGIKVMSADHPEAKAARNALAPLGKEGTR